MKSLLASRLGINPTLIPIKIHYFVFFAAIACALPFRTVYAKQLGISGTASGIIFAATSISRFLSNPLIGAILDHFKKFRLTLAMTVLFLALPHLAMIYIPPQTELSSICLLDEGFNYTCDARTWMLDSLDRHLNRNILMNTKPDFRMHCTFFVSPSENDTAAKGRPSSHQAFWNQSSSVNYTVIAITTEPSVSEVTLIRDGKIIFSNHSNNATDENDFCGTNKDTILEAKPCFCCGRISCLTESIGIYNATSGPEKISCTGYNQFLTLQFWTFFFLMIVSTSCLSAVVFMVDAICYEILEDKPEKYGEQRLFGTMGWGVGALIGGYFNQLFTADADVIDYSPCFYLLVGLCIVDLIPLFWVEVNNVKYSPDIFKDTKRLLSKPSVILYIIMVFFIGILSGLIWNYQFWFLEDIGASQLLLGLSQIVECFLAEVPCFIAAGWIIKKIGHMNCNSVTLIFFGLRYICFFYMFDPWWSLPAGLLHGPTFGLFFASMTAFAKEEALPGTEATTQAVLAASFEVVGVALGSFFGGFGFDKLGSRTTFLCAAIASFVLLLVNIILQYLIRKLAHAGQKTREDLDATKKHNDENNCQL